MAIVKSFPLTTLTSRSMREEIGGVCVFWAILELRVEHVIAHLEGNPMPRDLLRVEGDISARLKVLKKLAGNLPEAERDHLRQIAGEIKRVKELRHRVVHGLWGIDENGNYVSIYNREKHGQPGKPYTAERIRKIKLGILALTQQLELLIPPDMPVAPASPQTPP